MQPKVAALIACSGRFELLEHRALSSVRSQVRPPDVIVIVVDADYALLSGYGQVRRFARMSSPSVIGERRNRLQEHGIAVLTSYADVFPKRQIDGMSPSWMTMMRGRRSICRNV